MMYWDISLVWTIAGREMLAERKVVELGMLESILANSSDLLVIDCEMWNIVSLPEVASG